MSGFVGARSIEYRNKLKESLNLVTLTLSQTKLVLVKGSGTVYEFLKNEVEVFFLKEMDSQTINWIRVTENDIQSLRQKKQTRKLMTSNHYFVRVLLSNVRLFTNALIQYFASCENNEKVDENNAERSVCVLVALCHCLDECIQFEFLSIFVKKIKEFFTVEGELETRLKVFDKYSRDLVHKNYRGPSLQCVKL